MFIDRVVTPCNGKSRHVHAHTSKPKHCNVACFDTSLKTSRNCSDDQAAERQKSKGYTTRTKAGQPSRTHTEGRPTGAV